MLLSPPLNLPAPGRCQAIFVILTISHSHMFLVNSRLGHFSAPYSRRVRFSRSYAVNLPSSLAMIHSSTLGYSPFPPVSVYGTGRNTLHDARFSCKYAYLRCPLRRSFAVLSDFSRPTSFNRLFRQTAAVSLLGLWLSCIAGAGILTGCPSCTPLGFHLGPDLPSAV